MQSDPRSSSYLKWFQTLKYLYLLVFKWIYVISWYYSYRNPNRSVTLQITVNYPKFWQKVICRMHLFATPLFFIVEGWNFVCSLMRPIATTFVNPVFDLARLLQALLGTWSQKMPKKTCTQKLWPMTSFLIIHSSGLKFCMQVTEIPSYKSVRYDRPRSSTPSGTFLA